MSQKVKIISSICVLLVLLMVGLYYGYQFTVDKAFELAFENGLSLLPDDAKPSQTDAASGLNNGASSSDGTDAKKPNGQDEPQPSPSPDAAAAANGKITAKNAADLQKQISSQDKATVMGIVSSALSPGDYAYLASLAATDMNKAKSEAAKRLSNLSSSQKQQLINIYNKYIGLLN